MTGLFFNIRRDLFIMLAHGWGSYHFDVESIFILYFVFNCVFASKEKLFISPCKQPDFDFLFLFYLSSVFHLT